MPSNLKEGKPPSEPINSLINLQLAHSEGERHTVNDVDADAASEGNDVNDNFTLADQLCERICEIKLPFIGHLTLHGQIRALFLSLVLTMFFGGYCAWLSVSYDLMSLSSNLMFLGFGLMLVIIFCFALVLWQDSYIQAKKASTRKSQAEKKMKQEQQRENAARHANDQNQASILRLMNELQEVADGDLTIRATVSDDITGAIADSVNYTLEELRSMVNRVTTTTQQVSLAFTEAEKVAAELLVELSSTAHQQSNQIIAEQTQERVQQITQSIHELSGLVQELKTAVARFRVTSD